MKKIIVLILVLVSVMNIFGCGNKITIELSAYDLDIEIGEKITVVAKCSAENAVLKWKTKDEKIVSVYDGGIILGCKEGETEVVCSENYGRASATVKVKVRKPIAPDPDAPDSGDDEGGTALTYICNSVLRNYLAANRAESYRILKEYENSSSYRTVGYDYQALNITWQPDGSGVYSVYIADNEQYSNAYVAETSDTKLNSGICEPNKKYFVKISGDNGIVKEYEIKIADEPIRIVNIDGVTNARDIGGWQTKSGKYVKYGKVYRGAEFETVNYSKSHSTATDKGKKILKNHLGIKTEIDMRMSNEIPSGMKNSVGFENYYWKPLYPYSWIIPENNDDKFYNGATYQGSSANYLRDMFGYFADESKYPIYFHCIQGADRTGTLAFLLNGLLGVAFEDLVRDFELTTFSWQGLRTCIVDKNNLNRSTDPYICPKDQAKSTSALYGMYWQIMNYYGDESKDLSVAIGNYLKTACGVSQNTIDSIKNIMLCDK